MVARQIKRNPAIMQILSTIIPSKNEYINGLTVLALLIFLPRRSHWYPPTTDPVRHPTTNMEAEGERVSDRDQSCKK